VTEKEISTTWYNSWCQQIHTATYDMHISLTTAWQSASPQVNERLQNAVVPQKQMFEGVNALFDSRYKVKQRSSSIVKS
jgi:hypothetical protein